MLEGRRAKASAESLEPHCRVEDLEYKKIVSSALIVKQWCHLGALSQLFMTTGQAVSSAPSAGHCRYVQGYSSIVSTSNITMPLHNQMFVKCLFVGPHSDPCNCRGSVQTSGTLAGL